MGYIEGEFTFSKSAPKSDKIKEYRKLSGIETKEQRRKLLESMSNDEINQLISQAGNQQAKIFYAQFRKMPNGVNNV